MVHVDTAAAGEGRHLRTLLVLADRVDQHGSEMADALEVRRDPLGELALRIDGRIGERVDVVAGVVLVEHGLEQRALGAEGAEEGDFVDAGFGGDEPCGRARNPCFEYTRAAASRIRSRLIMKRILAQTYVYASTYLLAVRTIFASSIFGV